MAPRSGSRYTYGSTEDLSASRSPPQSRAPITEIDDDGSSSNYGLTSPKSVQGSRGWTWVRLAAVCAVALGVVMISVRSSSKKTIETPSFIEHDVDERTTPVMHPSVQELISVAEVDVVPQLSFSALNFYHIRDGKPAQDYPWLKDIKLIEPYRDTTLTVENPRLGYHYKWELPSAGREDELHTSADGVEAIAILTKLEDNVITLKELDSNGNVVRQLDETVMVKYVRREIRTLTDYERNELFDAMQKMWEVRVKGGNGREVFGDGYSDIWAINRLHYKAASPKECDHFHDGLGFLTNHMLITNTFEYSLQAINPKLTLPYWDFTIETSSAGEGAYGAEGDQSQTKTPVLQETWFGTVDPMDNMVKTGRWAYTPIPRMVMNNPGGINPDVYSKLRAPWNVNDRAYMTRGLGKMCHANIDEVYPWPTCSMHYELATEYDSFYDWVWASMYDPHGPVHIWIGGVLDCEGLYQKIGKLVGMDIANDLALVAFIHRKNLYRDGFFYCDGSVEVDVAPDEVFKSGVCGCLDYDLTQGDDYQTIFDTMYLMNYYLGDEDDDTKRKVVELICSTTINDGDHLQASSSLDPSFWATHPTMERLWMFAILTGRVTDFKWPDSDIEITESDGTTYTESISLYTDTCVGHRGGDIFPYDLLSLDADDFTVRTGIKGNPDNGGNIFTNREALAAFDPRINSLPYVYDTFKWLHCEKDGYNFDDAWMTRGDDASKDSGVKNIKHNADTTWGHSGAGVDAHAAEKGRRTRFEKDAPKYPLYGRLKELTADMKEKEARRAREL